jgi:hypothetical protein
VRAKYKYLASRAILFQWTYILSGFIDISLIGLPGWNLWIKLPSVGYGYGGLFDIFFCLVLLVVELFYIFIV